MKKLVLDLDTIEVTSFDTGGASGSPGTVQANAASRDPTCPNTVMDNSCEMSCAPSCASVNSCEFSCDPSCFTDCPAACGSFDVTCLETSLC